jgi:cell division protein FtsQ
MLKRRRNNRRTATDTPRWRWRWPKLDWSKIGLSLVGLAVVALMAAGLGVLLNQPIQRVIVTGPLQRVSALDVEQVVRSHLTGVGLVTVNLADISAAVRSLPWVETAAVQRSWPRALTVELIEQTPVARWNGTGLVNARGELFISEARFVPPELPQLSGPVGTEAEVTARYLAVQGRLTESGLRLVTLALDARGALEFTLDDGVLVRLGRTQVDQRFERFVRAAARLVSQRASDIGYVDMRYGNGFAVGWKGGATHLASAPGVGTDG